MYHFHTSVWMLRLYVSCIHEYVLSVINTFLSIYLMNAFIHKKEQWKMEKSGWLGPTGQTLAKPKQNRIGNNTSFTQWSHEPSTIMMDTKESLVLENVTLTIIITPKCDTSDCTPIILNIWMCVHVYTRILQHMMLHNIIQSRFH